MKETSKTNEFRNADFFSKYMTGSVLDIGAGGDLVVPHAQEFDMKDGDANRIDQYLEKNSFDCVHSSHCLEHMFDPEDALQRWWSLVKTGGHMVLVVPDEALYEQGYWPSRFNTDHKARFRLKDDLTTKESKILSVESLARDLKGAEVVSLSLQDFNYDYELISQGQSFSEFGFSLKKVLWRIVRLKAKKDISAKKTFDRLFFKWFSIPVDQTSYGTLAQIELVLKKV